MARMEMFLGFELARNYRVKKLNVVTDLDSLKEELSKCNIKGSTTYAVSAWSDIAAAIAQLNVNSFEPSHSYIDSVEDEGPNVVVTFRKDVAPDLDEDDGIKSTTEASLPYSTMTSSLDELRMAAAPADEPPGPVSGETQPSEIPPEAPSSDSSAMPTTSPDEVIPENSTAAPTEGTTEAPISNPDDKTSDSTSESTVAPSEIKAPEQASEAPSTPSNEPDDIPHDISLESTAAPTEGTSTEATTEAPTIANTEVETTAPPTEQATLNAVPTVEPTAMDDEAIIPGDDEYIDDEPKRTSPPTENHHHHQHNPTASPTHMRHSTNKPSHKPVGKPTLSPTKKDCKCKNQTGCLSKHSAPCCEGLLCKDFRWFSQCVEDESHHRHQVC